MAWRCSGSSNEELVSNLERAGLFKSPDVKNAMLAVDRADFSSRDPYSDQPQYIGSSATISAPHMHATALEHLKDHLVEGSRALDVGSGSGYLTACMAHMAGPSGKVVGVEHIPELVELSRHNVNRHHSDLLSSGRLKLVEGDGRLGWKDDAPYNAIHVGAAAERVPHELANQLAEGGRMVIPVGREHGRQEYLQMDKKDGALQQKVVENVRYVPLTSKSHQLHGFD